MPLSAQLLIQAQALMTNVTADLSVPNASVGFASQINLDNGTGANQADRCYVDTNVLTASSTVDVDLAGALTDVLGAALTFVRVKAILVRALATNVNNVVVGGAASNQFIGPFGAAAHTIAVKPGGFLALVAPDATAWPVTAATADLLRFGNSGAGSSVGYDVMIIGASA